MKARIRGYSLVEIVVAAVIFGIVAAASMKAFMFISKQSVRVDERAFAVQKAVQMMEELRSLVQDENSTVGVLDGYDTGSTVKYTLSTLAEVNGNSAAVDPNDKPGDPISGNGDLKDCRKVTIKTTNEPLSRQVFVRIYRAKDGELLAETGSVLRTVPPNYVPTQNYDVYLLELDNVPGWWVALGTLAPTFNALIQDLESRNPGLILRTHLITRLAYGRDPYYRPFVNIAAPTNATAPRAVYFLPGNLDNSFTYFISASMKSRLNVDGALIQDESDPGTPYPYSMADQYNHAVRAPDEERIFAEHYAASVAAGQTPPEVSWRLLLDRMNNGGGVGPDGPYDYRNILLINLHGEMVPMPPLRNYSDPAKRPTAANANDRQVRAVTHPENLSSASGAAVTLRVYTFVADPTNNGIGAFPDAGSMLNEMSVTVVSTNAVPANIQTALAGNIQIMDGDGGLGYAWRPATSPADYDITVSGSSQTIITLKNSPLRSPWNGGQGLATADRLYGLEYIPCPPVNNTFAPDLASGAGGPKNTARWTITFPAGTLPDGVTAFDTRIGTDTVSGTTLDEPSNFSRTYAWVGATVPLTEQSQFIGDPRHQPYADVKAFHKYNWFFKNVNIGGYAGFVNDANNNLWTGFGDTTGLAPNYAAAVNMDVPRFWEVLRKALINTTGVMNSISGWSFYYMGVGGEMGADSNNGFPDGLPIVGRPWAPTDAAQQGIDEISQWPSADYFNSRIIAHSGNGNTNNTDWTGLHWIGELYPTLGTLDASTLWISSGNLMTGDSGFYPNWQKRYFRSDYSNGNLRMAGQNIGAVLPYNPRKQPGKFSAPSFFNGNATGGGTNNFNHNSNANTANLTSSGTAVSQDFNFPLSSPLDSALTASGHRPFNADSTSPGPMEWAQTGYSSQRTILTVPEKYYDSSVAGCDTSALMRISLNNQYGYFQPNGMGSQPTFGAGQIGKLGLVNVLRAFMAMGAPNVSSGTIPQVPLVSISSPAVTDEFNNPATINVVWSSTWTRWDGQPYTSAYTGVPMAQALTYNLKVSADGGSNWKYVNTNTSAQEGVLDPAQALNPPVTWVVPSAGFPQGNYDLLVEAYRNNRGLHYSYHRRRVFIRR